MCTPTKEHSLPRHVQQGFVGRGEEMQEGEKKKSSLYFTTAKGISKTFLYSYNVLFRYNVISLNINLPGPDSLLLE